MEHYREPHTIAEWREKCQYLEDALVVLTDGFNDMKDRNRLLRDRTDLPIERLAAYTAIEFRLNERQLQLQSAHEKIRALENTLADQQRELATLRGTAQNAEDRRVGV